MEPGIVQAIIAGVFGVAIAVIGWWQVKAKRRDDARRQVDECIMGMTAANSDALMVVLKHLDGQQLNGDVRRAMDTITREVDEYSKVRDHVVSNL